MAETQQKIPTASNVLKNVFIELKDFEGLVDDAKKNARTEYERRFINGICKSYKEYGAAMRWSSNQHAMLEKLAYAAR